MNFLKCAFFFFAYSEEKACSKHFLVFFLQYEVLHPIINNKTETGLPDAHFSDNRHNLGTNNNLSYNSYRT